MKDPRARPEAVVRVLDAPGYEPCAPSASVAWGGPALKFVLKSPVTREVTVVDGADGSPVPEFELKWKTVGHLSKLMHEVSHESRDRRGKLQVSGLWRGPSELRIVPKSRTLLPAVLRPRIDDGVAKVVVRLTRLAPKKLSVVDHKGQPVGKVRVEVIDPGTIPMPGNAEWVNDERGAFQARALKPGVRYPTLIDRSTSDALGQCIVYGVPDRLDHVLRLHFGAEAPLELESISFGKTALSLRVTLPSR